MIFTDFKRDKKTSPDMAPSGDTVLRCVMDEKGYILNTNDTLTRLCTAILKENHPHISDIVAFIDLPYTEDGYHIAAGSYDATLIPTGETTTLTIDSITTAEGRDVMIGVCQPAQGHVSPRMDDNDTNHQGFQTLLNQINLSTARLKSAHITERTTKPFAPQDYATFAEISDTLLITLDMRHTIISCNPHAQNHLATHHSFIDMIDEDDQHEIRAIFDTLNMVHDRTLPCETRLSSPQDQQPVIAWRFTRRADKIFVIGTDITAEKTREHDFTRRQTQLNEAESIAHMGHWYWHIASGIIEWSNEIYNIFGVNRDTFEPSVHALSPYIHKRDLGRVLQIFQRAMIEEKNYDMEFRINHPDGSIRYLMCEGRCERNEDGEVIALYGIMQDLTERILYEEELLRAKDAIEQAYAAKSRFLANMSHELRTPLNAIIGFSEMIEQELLGPVFNDRYIEYAGNIHSSGNYLLELISDILDMSKIEAGKHSLDIEDIRIADVIERAVQMTQGRVAEDGLKLSTPLPQDMDITLQADRRAIIQIVLNILSNAIKFTPSGGRIKLSCENYDDHIVLEIRDTGIGIPAHKISTVLKPFEQVSSEFTREHEGTGLGLSITQELIALHHGKIDVQSQVDIGTAVRITLPKQHIPR